MAVPLSQIVALVEGRYDGPDAAISGVATLKDATSTDISFFANPKYASDLATTRAAAVVVANDHEGDSPRWLRVPRPHVAIARVISEYFSARPTPQGISPLASIAATARLGSGVAVGAFSSIGDSVIIGDRVVIYPNVTVEAETVIGEDTILYPHVSIYYGSVIGRRCVIHSGAVVGSDGYGFAADRDVHYKIPQIGIVRIEDDVEIGAGTTIDRAALGETVIGEGTKIDNLVQIGHNVKVGRRCLLVSQVGIAGSTELGDDVVVAGQSGFAGHLTIGNRVQVAAKSAVLADVPDDTKVMGIPAVPFREFARREAGLRKLGKKK